MFSDRREDPVGRDLMLNKKQIEHLVDFSAHMEVVDRAHLSRKEMEEQMPFLIEHVYQALWYMDKLAAEEHTDRFRVEKAIWSKWEELKR